MRRTNLKEYALMLLFLLGLLLFCLQVVRLSHSYLMTATHGYPPQATVTHHPPPQLHKHKSRDTITVNSEAQTKQGTPIMYGAPGNGLGVLKPTSNPFLVAVNQAQQKQNTTGISTPYSPEVLRAVRDQSGQSVLRTPQSGTYTAPAGGAAPAPDPQQQALMYQINSGIQGAQSGLGRLDTQLQNGYGNIDREYQSEYEMLTGSRARNLDRYQQQETDQLNQYGQVQNRNNTASRNWLEGAQRTIGTQGAGQGSAARYALPFEAQTQAAAANSAAQQTNEMNMGAIASSRREDEDRFADAIADLAGQRDQGRNDLTSRIEAERANLLGTIGQLEGQRAIANGGGWERAIAAAAPYTSRINDILANIDRLSVTATPKARQVTLGRPDLSQYNWSREIGAPQARQDVTLQPAGRNPIAALFGLQDERQTV